MIAVAFIDGMMVSPRDFIGEGGRLIEIAAILATAVTAAISALASTVPGASRKWLFLPRMRVFCTTKFGIPGAVEGRHVVRWSSVPQRLQWTASLS